jgi:hypothetical protein
MLDPSAECLEITLLLDSFHDNELPENEKQLVLKHLPTCERCQGRLGEIESLVGALRSLPRLEMPHSLKVDWSAYIDRHDNAGKVTMSNAEPIKKMSEESKVVPISTIRGIRKWRPMLTAAAGLVVLIVAAGFLRHAPVSPVGPSLADKLAPASPTEQQSSPPLVASNAGSGHEGSPVTPVIRPHLGTGAQSTQRGVDGDLIALYSNDANLVSEELGIATDEDGLYALKL